MGLSSPQSCRLVNGFPGCLDSPKKMRKSGNPAKLKVTKGLTASLGVAGLIRGLLNILFFIWFCIAEARRVTMSLHSGPANLP